MKFKLFPILALALLASSCSKEEDPSAPVQEPKIAVRLTKIEIDYKNALVKQLPEDQDIAKKYIFPNYFPFEQDYTTGGEDLFKETSYLEVDIDCNVYTLQCDYNSAKLQLPTVKYGPKLIKDEDSRACHSVTAFNSTHFIEKSMFNAYTYHLPPFSQYELTASYKTFAVEAPITVTLELLDGPNSGQILKKEGIWRGVVVADRKEYSPTLKLLKYDLDP